MLQSLCTCVFDYTVRRHRHALAGREDLHISMKKTGEEGKKEKGLIELSQGL